MIKTKYRRRLGEMDAWMKSGVANGKKDCTEMLGLAEDRGEDGGATTDCRWADCRSHSLLLLLALWFWSLAHFITLFKIYLLPNLFMCRYMSVWVSAMCCVHTQGDQKTVLGLLELKLQVVMSHLMSECWRVSIFRPSRRAVFALNPWAIFSTPTVFFFF